MTFILSLTIYVSIACLLMDYLGKRGEDSNPALIIFMATVWPITACAFLVAAIARRRK